MSQSMMTQHTALIAYPVQAAVNRILPKNKIYERSGANTKLKNLFVEQVEQIVWQYKLAPETVNLPARPGVPEIQVFGIQLKTDELHWDVLRCIDDAIQYPIIFELTRGDYQQAFIQVTAAYRRPNESGANRWVLSDYFSTDWLPVTSERTIMPLALDLASLYEQFLHRLIPLGARREESLMELMARVEKVESKRHEVEKTATRLAKEKQFNRKVEINAALRQLTQELEALK